MPPAQRRDQAKPVTAETHRATLMRKLGIKSLAGLVRYAIRNNIIEA